MASGIRIFDVFKAAYLWQRFSIRPTLKKDPKTQRVVFVFPQDEEILRGVTDFQEGASTPLKEWIERFKNLRQEMYLVRGSTDESR
jgi:hypothetical protein